ncbi:MAG: hypothetical protein ACAH80_03910 [Alphaproteobacteria bacterium]
MMQPGHLKKAIIALFFVAFLGLGFVSVNVMTSCESEAQCFSCGNNICISPFLGTAFGIGQVGILVTMPDIALAVTQLTVYFQLAMTAFVAAISQKILQVTRNIVAWIDTFWWYNLRPAMMAMTDQLTAIDTFKHSQLGMMADATASNRTSREHMKNDIKAHRNQRPGENVCRAGTVMGGMTRSSTFRRAYETAATLESAPRSANRAGTPAARGTAADMNRAWSNYVTNYCDPNDNAGVPGCTAPGTLVVGGVGGIARDMDVTGEIFMKDTIDIRVADTKKVIDDLIINLAEPLVKEPVSGVAMRSGQGQENFLESQAYKAKRQAVYDLLYYVVARRTPGTDMQQFLRPIREAAGMDAAYISDNPSHNEVLKVMTSERFRTGQLSIEQIDEPENNAREMVIQQAFQAMLMADQLDLMDRYGLILAAQVGPEVKDAKPFELHSLSQSQE